MDRPSGRNEDLQFEGLFRGIGLTSKEPICSKRATSVGRVHNATHFAIGCKKWDDGAMGPSAYKSVHTDPQVVYATRDCPDKNSSVVELRQREHVPELHYRTEQRERFSDRGIPPRAEQFRHDSSVHFGDDKPELVTQTGYTHFRPADAEGQRAASRFASGVGRMVVNTPWPKPERCHPIHAGARSLEAYDLGVHSGMQFGKYTANHSAIATHHHVRDPIAGHHIAVEAFKKPGAKTTLELIEEHNSRVPALRSLGALRPDLP